MDFRKDFNDFVKSDFSTIDFPFRDNILTGSGDVDFDEIINTMLLGKYLQQIDRVTWLFVMHFVSN